MSAIGRYCCKSRKSNNPKNLANEAIWSLTSPLRSPPRKDFCNNIGTKRTSRDVRSLVAIGGRADVVVGYAASRRVISAKAACPSFVSEYGALNSWLVFSTKCFRLRYCMSAFIDSRCILNIFVTSLIRSAPVSRIAESTLRTRSDSTGGRGASA